MLELKNVSGTGKKSCLKDISFELPAGYILGITGENGAGKTTLLRTIFGEKTYTGTILLQGTDVSSMGAKRKEKMALVSEEAGFSACGGAVLPRFHIIWIKSVWHAVPLLRVSRGGTSRRVHGCAHRQRIVLRCPRQSGYGYPSSS